MATNETPSAASWDLTPHISPYLDLHMMFPLLEYVDSLISSGTIPYSTSDVAAARLSLIRATHMVDYAMDIYRELHGADGSNPEEIEIPEEMESQKKQVLDKLAELKANAGCKSFDELCQNQELRVSFLFCFLVVKFEHNYGFKNSKFIPFLLMLFSLC